MTTIQEFMAAYLPLLQVVGFMLAWGLAMLTTVALRSVVS